MISPMYKPYCYASSSTRHLCTLGMLSCNTMQYGRAITLLESCCGVVTLHGPLQTYDCAIIITRGPHTDNSVYSYIPTLRNTFLHKSI